MSQGSSLWSRSGAATYRLRKSHDLPSSSSDISRLQQDNRRVTKFSLSLTSCHSCFPPLNALIKDQMRQISQGTLTVAALNVKRNHSNLGNFDLEGGNAHFSQLQDAEYDIIFKHPEAFLSCKQDMSLLQSSPY